MTDYRNVLERDLARVGPAPFDFDDVARRRDRKRRDQRIAAGVVGIAVFVAAVWIVTSGGAFDRSETSVVPGGDVTGPAETGPTETGPAVTAPPSAPASAAPDVVEQKMCSDGARVRLELTNIGGVTGLFSSIVVRFELYGSPVGHEWRILLERFSGMDPPIVIMRGTRVASDNGDLVVHRNRFRDGKLRVWFRAKALDRQTGQVCKALGVI